MLVDSGEDAARKKGGFLSLVRKQNGSIGHETRIARVFFARVRFSLISRGIRNSRRTNGRQEKNIRKGASAVFARDLFGANPADDVT